MNLSSALVDYLLDLKTIKTTDILRVYNRLCVLGVVMTPSVITAYSVLLQDISAPSALLQNTRIETATDCFRDSLLECFVGLKLSLEEPKDAIRHKLVRLLYPQGRATSPTTREKVTLLGTLADMGYSMQLAGSYEPLQLVLVQVMRRCVSDTLLGVQETCALLRAIGRLGAFNAVVGPEGLIPLMERLLPRLCDNEGRLDSSGSVELRKGTMGPSRDTLVGPTVLKALSEANVTWSQIR